MLTPASHIHAVREPHPISAVWALSAASALGAEFLHWLMCEASIVGRQVSFAVFARKISDGCDVAHGNLAALSHALRMNDPREILAEVFGACPHGLVSGFSRIGHDAFAEPSSYLRHHALYADPAHRQRLTVMRHVGRLTEERLNALFEIDPAFLTVQWIRQASPRRARLLTQVIAMIRANASPEADAAIKLSVSEGGPVRSYREALTSWLTWCSFPDVPPLDEPDLGIRVVRNAAVLMEKARIYQNCSARLNRLIDAVAGRTVYLTYEPQGQPLAMASLLPSSGSGWLVEGIYGVKNARLSPEDQAPLRAWLSRNGVHGVCRPPLAAGWQAALSLVGVPDEELVEFDDLNDLLSAAA